MLLDDKAQIALSSVGVALRRLRRLAEVAHRAVFFETRFRHVSNLGSAAPIRNRKAYLNPDRSYYGGPFMVKFRTELLGQERMNATGMIIPPEVVEALGSGKRPPVKVTLNGRYTYRNT